MEYNVCYSLQTSPNARVTPLPGALVRSSSAPLPPHVFAELEQMFEAPVIEFYGMTETASSPLACNPLPPRVRKPGSVGIPINLDVAVMDDRGTLLPGRQTGELAGHRWRIDVAPLNVTVQEGRPPNPYVPLAVNLRLQAPGGPAMQITTVRLVPSTVQ